MSFRLEGQEFTALNGGPHFKFTEAISFVGEVRDAGRSRSLLGWAARRRRRAGAAMRLTEGQIRRLVANHSGRPVRNDRRRGQREIRTRHASHAADEEIGPGGAATHI